MSVSPDDVNVTSSVSRDNDEVGAITVLVLVAQLVQLVCNNYCSVHA